MPAPTDLEDLGYGRGQLRAGPAASVRRLDVLLGRPLDINRAYASYEQQMRYYLAYVAYINGRGPWAPLALHPDKSWHCRGMAIDTDDRLGATFTEHGWLFEVDGEPWHGQYYTSLDKHYGEPAGGNERPIPIPDPAPAPVFWKDDTMRIFAETNGSYFLAKPGGIVGIKNQRDLALLRRLLDSDPNKPDTFNAAERDIIGAYLAE